MASVFVEPNSSKTKRVSPSFLEGSKVDSFVGDKATGSEKEIRL
jgi:hypothetical protein